MAAKGVVEEVSAGGVVFRRTTAGLVVLLIKDSYKNWGFPKGHVEAGEDPATAALRETREETGLHDLALRGAIQEIDWFFRFKGRLIHKTCHFFLIESPTGEPAPQRAEGITAVRWMPLEEALRTVSYANARDVLRAAGEMVGRLSAA